MRIGCRISLLYGAAGASRSKPRGQLWLAIERFPDYAATWIEERLGLRRKTVVNYRSLLRCHIAPHLTTVTVGELTLARVRRWRKKLLDSGTGPVAAAKAYRLLHAVMNTAVDDGLD